MTIARPWGHTTLLALLLALASAFFAVRSTWVTAPEPPVLHGLFDEASAPRAHALVQRLTTGLIALQREDGGFDLGPRAEYSWLIERIAASSLATACLAHVWSLGPTVHVEGLEEALAKGLAYVRRQQTPTGAIGNDEPKDHWSQVDGTCVAILAFLLTEAPEDADVARGAARAVARFARAGLRNGWTRASAVMVIDRVVQQGHAGVFDRPWRQLVDWRELKEKPSDKGIRASDWNLAEAISRVVLGLRKGVDPFPAQVARASLEDLPVWSGQSSDCQGWWMQAWLVARSGSPDAAAWFARLLQVLETDAIAPDGIIHGGWYANSVSQTTCAVFALSEGLMTEVVFQE